MIGTPGRPKPLDRPRVVRVVLTTWLLALLAAGASALPASSASVKEVVSANYYFEDPATGSRTEIRASVGDQLRISHTGPGQHTVDVDELGIHSPMFTDGQSFTTPPLDTPGTYRFYCDPHEGRGHVTTLVVVGDAPAPSPTPTPTPSPTPTASSSPSPSPTSPTSSSPPAASTSPSPSSTAVGESEPSPAASESGAPAPAATGGTSDGSGSPSPDASPGPGAADQAEPVDGAEPAVPGSATDGEPDTGVVASGLSGDPGSGGSAPWTRGVWLGLLGVLPIGAGAAWSLAGRDRGAPGS